MNRAFLVNIALLIFINLLIKPFYVLVIDVTVQNTIGPVSYGIFFSLFNFCYLFQVATDLGIQNYNSRIISQDRSLARSYIPRIITIKLLLTVFFFVLIIIIAWLFNYPKTYFPLLLLIGLNQVIVSFILYFRSNLSALGFFKTDSLVSALDKLLLILILSYLLWISPQRGDFRLEWFIWSQTISLSISLIVIALILYKRVPFFRLRWSFAISFDLIKKSLPYASIIILMTAYTRMDGVMIERILPDGKLEAGIYAAAYRLLDASNMIAYLFASLLLPMFARLISIQKPTNELIHISFRLIFLIALSISLFCFFERKEIMVFLYPIDGNTYYGEVLGILIFSFVAIAISYIYGSLLTANGNIRQLNVIFLLGVLINLILNLILIPIYKAYGAALATLITQAFVMFGQVICAQVIFSFRIRIKHVSQVAIFLLSSLLIFYSLSKFDITPWWMNAFLGMLLCMLVSLLIKFNDIAKLKRILILKP